ncbi:MAG: DUF1800 domain-containing protein [Planctomycetota bacterium]|jgi:uncharacterized protein (DUF1800 family)
MSEPTLREAEGLWAPFVPGRDGPFDRRRATHLLRRLTLFATPEEVDASLERGFEDTLAYVLRRPGRDSVRGTLRDALAASADRDEVRALQAGWLDRMLSAPNRLVERMALVWHNHFATSLRKVRSPVLMARQVEAFRRLGLGRFGPLVKEIARDPAMLIWLDAEKNSKEAPNENLARELFELFVLGRGHYGEADVLEAARALTGFRVISGRTRFLASEHDRGSKTVLGRTGALGLDDVCDAALAQEAAPRWIARRLVTELCIGDPSEAIVEPLARRLRRTDFDLFDAVGTIARSRFFLSDRAIGMKVRSPLEYGLAAIAGLDARVPLKDLAAALERMGMSLLQPPNVAGWKGGSVWVNAATLGERYGFAKRITAAPARAFGPSTFDPLPALKRLGVRTVKGLVDHYTRALLARQPTPETQRELITLGERTPGSFGDRARAVALAVLTLPEAHLG